MFFIKFRTIKEMTFVNFWGEILLLLDKKMEVPQSYGLFHIFFFALPVVLAIVLWKIRKHPDERFIRKLMLIISVIVLLLEIYKQINMNFTYDGQTITFDYQWYIFPFQFCSTPLYIGFLTAFTRKGKVHDACCAYLATFAMFAGLCVMVYPVQVFISTIGINIQSMLCHGAMIMVSIYLFATGYVKAEHKTILRAIPVFAVCISLAMIMNEVAYKSGVLNGETFNMFFISPYFPPSLPVYSSVQAVVPYPWSLFIYIVAFSLASYIVLLIPMLIKHIASKKAKKKELLAEEERVLLQK